jgi:hypothetical protein
MRSAPIRKATVNEVSATRLADADGGRRSVAPFRLLRYTAAASAAALGSAANAGIVTGGTVSTGVLSQYQSPPPVGSPALGKSDFGSALNVMFWVQPGEQERRLKVARQSAASSFQFLRATNGYAVGLAYGDVIQATPGAGRTWANSANLAHSQADGSDPWAGIAGSWKLPATPSNVATNSVQHYLAFRFTTDGGSTYQYGWMNVEWWATIFGDGQGYRPAVDVRHMITINGWAYNTAGSITAGFSGTAVPSGGGVLALAAGAAGLRGRRRGRN